MAQSRTLLLLNLALNCTRLIKQIQEFQYELYLTLQIAMQFDTADSYEI